MAYRQHFNFTGFPVFSQAGESALWINKDLIFLYLEALQARLALVLLPCANFAFRVKTDLSFWRERCL